MEPSSIPPKPSGIPRPSRLPVPKAVQGSTTIRAGPQTSQLRPAPSVDRLRNKASISSLSRKSSSSSLAAAKAGSPGRKLSVSPARRTVEPGDAVFKKPVGRPPSRQSHAHQSAPQRRPSRAPAAPDDRPGALEGRRTSPRQRAGGEALNGSEPAAAVRDSSTPKPRGSRPSLSDRTIESLSHVPPSPVCGRRKSSFFQPESPMGPPPRPASATDSTIRPGSSDGSARSSLHSTPSKASLKPSRPAANNPARRTSTAAAGKRSVSAALPRPSSTASRAAPSKDQRPSQQTQAASRTTPRLLGSKTVGARAPKPRPSLGSIFAGPPRPGASSSPAVQSPKTKAPGAHRPSLGPRKSASSSSLRVGPAAGDSPRKVSSSSAALREQIAKAKAAHRRASNMAASSTAGFVDTGFDFGLHSDPFSQSSSAAAAAAGLLRKRVDAARADGRLNISAMALKEIPDEVLKMYDFTSNASSPLAWGEVVDLVRLVCADNEIEALPDALFPDVDPEDTPTDDSDQGSQFGGVEVLDLHGNLLRDVPLGLRRLERLTVLNLSRNKLDNRALDTVHLIRPLRELKLAENDLEGCLDGAIGDLKSLEVLELQGNRLTGLADGVGRLTSLRVLNVCNNRLQTLPMAALGELPVAELYASKNALSGALFPESVSAMPNLRMLDVSVNSLTCLTVSQTLDMPALSTLDISSNRVSRLPDISSWGCLYSLLAEDNRLSELPAGLVSLQALRNVNFTGNDIVRLDERIALMEGLESFLVAANPLRERKHLTMTTDELKRDLRARFQRLHPPEEPPEEEDHAAELTASEDTFLTADEGWKLTPSGTLDLSSRDLCELDAANFQDFVAAHDVRQLVLHHNKFPAIPACTSLAAGLTMLDLSNNALSSASLERLELPHVRELRLAGNKLFSLESLIIYVSAPQLQHLDVTYNRLSGALPTLRKAFPDLTILSASDNAIEEISFAALQGLRAVDLSNNDIGRLPPEIGLLAHTLTSFNVEGNRFRAPGYHVLKRGTEAILDWLKDKIPENERPE